MVRGAKPGAIPMGPGSRRRCPVSSPGANGTKEGLLRRLFFVGPSAVAALVAPIGLAPGLAPLPLPNVGLSVWFLRVPLLCWRLRVFAAFDCFPRSNVYDLADWPFRPPTCGAHRAGSHEVPVWTIVLSNVSSLRMQATIATLKALPRSRSLSL